MVPVVARAHALAAAAGRWWGGCRWWGARERAGMAALAGCTALGGCVANSVALEAVVRADRRAGELLNCGRALVVGGFHLAERALVSDRFRGPPLGAAAALPRTIPLWYHALMAFVFVPMSFLNNYAFALGVSQPLQIVVRSLSPLTTMLVGLVLPAGLRKYYSWQQQLCVVAITVGAVATTAADAVVQLTSAGGEAEDDTGGASAMAFDAAGLARAFASDAEFRSWCLGVAILVLAALVTAGLNQLQDYGFRHWGKDWQESVVFVHILSLPAYWLQRGELAESAARLAATHPAPAFGRWLRDIGLGWAAPSGLAFMGLDALTMLGCQRGVHSLLAKSGGLTLAITLAVRKVLSLLISLVLYSQPFTLNHWAGTALVFAGTIAFTQVPKGAAPQPGAEAKKEQ